MHVWGWILALHSFLPNYAWPLWRPRDLSFPYCVLFILEPVDCFQIVPWISNRLFSNSPQLLFGWSTTEYILVKTVVVFFLSLCKLKKMHCSKIWKSCNCKSGWKFSCLINTCAINSGLTVWQSNISNCNNHRSVF